MAGTPTFDTSSAAEMDYPEHEKTYNLFLGLVKWGAIGVVIILVFMALFLL
ncbi:aa3-type cytochrome c oxidase subunit IV [Aurantimonas sp. VKM B-3413]|uniref:aa3-type cytochrome c oxidase subunit IV n=1 Tax=Aurantimonas sp. VKM B-3413 TaxID=2779401 RepID=UPI001E6055DA|nr:aa3-type cytochrome c oxidase subunit IV [Aurantimonas sp. VKM B-3413]